jgi:hypothetical protein
MANMSKAQSKGKAYQIQVSTRTSWELAEFYPRFKVKKILVPEDIVVKLVKLINSILKCSPVRVWWLASAVWLLVLWHAFMQELYNFSSRIMREELVFRRSCLSYFDLFGSHLGVTYTISVLRWGFSQLWHLPCSGRWAGGGTSISFSMTTILREPISRYKTVRNLIKL